MSINGICQSCGFVAPMECFLAETEHRQLSAILAELPKDVQGVAFHYLSLFRPSKSKAVQAKKAARLMSEIRDLVKVGHVQVKGKVARPCSPQTWVKAIEKMVEQRDRLSLPMPNHNYLLQIAYDLADQADARAERNPVPVKRSVSNSRVPASIQSPLDQYIQGLRDTKPTDEEMDEWKTNRMK